jgi:hypothetical protein
VPRKADTVSSFLRRVVALGCAVAAVAAVAGLGYLLVASAVREERHHVSFADIQLDSLPPFVAPAFLDEVRQRGALPAVLDLRHDGLLARLHTAFSLHAWVERVDEVRLAAPGRVRVKLSFRTPVARAPVGAESFWLDRHGVLLPAPQGAPRVLTLLGVPAQPPVGPGSTWPDPEVQRAARLAGFLLRDAGRLQLHAVEIRRDPVDGVLVLRTERGSTIIWESLTGPSASPATPPAERLQRLWDYVEQYGNLDAPAGPYDFDARPGAGLLRRPAAAAVRSEVP